jgi:hypothetical protein
MRPEPPATRDFRFHRSPDNPRLVLIALSNRSLLFENHGQGIRRNVAGDFRGFFQNLLILLVR